MKFTLIGVLAAVAAISDAQPTVGYPFNNQYPPVARYGKEYKYQLASDTFSSTDPNSLKYSANGLPDWLKLDSDTKTLSGTPPDEGSKEDTTINFQLIATDSTGSANSDCSLQLTNSPAPVSTNDALISQLRKSGPVAGADGLVLTPGQPFSISFPKDFYTKPEDSSQQISGYTCLMEDHTPLPIWMNFDQGSGTLAGNAPAINSQIAPAQSFGVALIVIDHDGFSSSDTYFQLIVGAHQLTTNITMDNINATAGKQFTYQIPLNEMSLDKQPLKMSDVSSIDVNTTNWLSVDNATAKITGTPPKDVSGSQVFQIKITDVHSDVMEYNLNVNVGSNHSSMFTESKIGVVNATMGGFFQYSLKNVLLDDSAKVSASFDPPADWVEYHQDNQSFTGQVPSSFKSSEVTLTATDGDKEETAKFQLTGVKAVKKDSTPTSSTTSSTKTSSVAASSSGSTTTAEAVKGNNNHHKTVVAAVCGTIIPISVIGAAAAIFFLCRKRGRKVKNRSISPPILPDEDSVNHDIEKSPATTFQSPNGAKMDAPSKDSYDMQWDSPQKVLALNFMKMDSSGEDLNYSSESTHVGSPSTNHSLPNEEEDILPSAPNTPAGFKSPVVGSRRPDSEEMSARPRNSWRQPEQEGRWQEHKSMGSTATINTDELLTMRLVDRQSTDSAHNSVRNSQNTSNRNSYMSPTKSRILTPHQSMMIREESSGNVRQLGSHSSSLNDAAATAPLAVATENNQEASANRVHHDQSLKSVKEESFDEDNHAYYQSALNYSQTSFQSDDEASTSREHYRTASDGSDGFQSGSSLSDEEAIRPYRNSRGEMELSQVDLSYAAEDEAYRAQTPENQTDRFSFTPHGDQTGQSNIDTFRNSRNTLRLVDSPGRRSLAQTPEQVSTADSSPRIPPSSSAELAFL